MDRKVNPSVAETVASESLMGNPLGSQADDISRVTSAAAEDEGRFVPGTLLGGRYRIIGLLGRGGMGEAYRATDLTLGQSVALKFLPEEASRNQRLLERFHGEVRVARLVSHPNVCRVYDIGEVEGMPFISMEYVDGEDLASLLLRIGRLPADKALETARTSFTIDSLLKQLQSLRDEKADEAVHMTAPASAVSPSPRPARAAAPAATPAPAPRANATTPAAARVQPDSGPSSPPPADLAELWVRLLEAVGRASPFTRTYLLEAHLVSFQKDLFTIGFDPEFEDHIGLVDNARNHTLLQTKLLELGYQKAQIKFIKAVAPEKPAAAPEEPAAPPPPATDVPPRPSAPPPPGGAVAA